MKTICRKIIVVMWLVLRLILAHTNATPERILYVEQPPINVSAFTGYTAKFHCVSHGRSYIFWFSYTNGSDILISQSGYNTSSVSKQRMDGISGENSTLSVMASELTNGTQYTCGVLDLSTNNIVEYSSPATLLVQGKPLPPNGLRVYCEANYNLRQVEMFLQWNNSITIFDEINTEEARNQVSKLGYVVYGYFNNTDSTESGLNQFYKNKTKALYHTIYCDIDPWLLETTLFSISAEFEKVGEGMMSKPVKCIYELNEIRKLATHKNGRFVVLFSSIIIMTLLVIIIASMLIWFIRHRCSRFRTVAITQNSQINSPGNNIVTNNIPMESNSAYEFRSDKFGIRSKASVWDCQPNSAYSSVTVTAGHESSP